MRLIVCWSKRCLGRQASQSSDLSSSLFLANITGIRQNININALNCNQYQDINHHQNGSLYMSSSLFSANIDGHIIQNINALNSQFHRADGSTIIHGQNMSEPSWQQWSFSWWFPISSSSLEDSSLENKFEFNEMSGSRQCWGPVGRWKVSSSLGNNLQVFFWENSLNSMRRNNVGARWDIGRYHHHLETSLNFL